MLITLKNDMFRCFRKRRTRRWLWNKFERGRSNRNVNYSAPFAMPLLRLIYLPANPANECNICEEMTKLGWVLSVRFVTVNMDWIKSFDILSTPLTRVSSRAFKAQHKHVKYAKCAALTKMCELWFKECNLVIFKDCNL